MVLRKNCLRLQKCVNLYIFRYENETRPCNPTLPVELVGEAQKIRGDAIGSTLYSQCWVLKVLMKLTQLSGEGALDERLEKELCLLWDMTVEEDVVWFLVRNDVLDIIAFVLRKDQEPRLMEILVGTLANLCVVAGVCRRAVRSPAVRELMARLLFCTDSLTLVQLMRLYVTCLQRLRGDAGQAEHQKSSGRECSDARSGDRSDGAEPDKEPCGGDEKFLEMLVTSDSWRKQITFLLQSSTNGALLSSMLHMLDELYLTAAECKTAVPSMYSAELIAAVVEALKELKAGVSAHGDDEAARKAVFQSLSIISNFVDSEQGVAALCETGDALASYVCTRVDQARLCGRLSLDTAQFVTRCLNVFGCAFASLACRADIAGWAVSLLGHLAERVTVKQTSLCGEDGFEAKDKEEEERHFDSEELKSEVENFCVFVVKCLSGGSDKVKWRGIEETLRGRCKQEHLDFLECVLRKHGFEDEAFFCTENT